MKTCRYCHCHRSLSRLKCWHSLVKVPKVQFLRLSLLWLGARGCAAKARILSIKWTSIRLSSASAPPGRMPIHSSYSCHTYPHRSTICDLLELSEICLRSAAGSARQRFASFLPLLELLCPVQFCHVTRYSTEIPPRFSTFCAGHTHLIHDLLPSASQLRSTIY
jgi:hypothetical protein